jgi:hypothetical protein
MSLVNLLNSATINDGAQTGAATMSLRFAHGSEEELS